MQRELLNTINTLKLMVEIEAPCYPDCCPRCPTRAFTTATEKKVNIRYPGATYTCCTKSSYLKEDIGIRLRPYNIGCAPIMGSYIAYMLDSLSDDELTIEK